ncbi:MAG: riboflavin synthase [Rhodovibrionaceae bacterium]
MFTGIITDLGRLAAREEAGQGRGDLRLTIETSYDMDEIALGASIACSGCCLTVVEKTASSFAADVSAETRSKTTLGGWRVGDPVNLERSLALGDELGGHLVYGHVDGLAEVVSLAPEGDSLRCVFAVPEPLARYIAAKGSVALDGVSLTVNEVEGVRFGVNVIAHTAEVTSFGKLAAGNRVNLEIDMLARYVARLLNKG